MAGNRSRSDGHHVSVIVPTYREAQNLEELVIRITQALLPLDIPFDILIVDDDSQDGTEELVRSLYQQGYDVHLIVRKGRRGLASAVLEGFAAAGGDILVCMDGDLSHPPEAVGQLVIRALDPEVDLALGSRYVPGGSLDPDWTRFRRWNSRAATWLARPWTSVRDPLSGFFALRRDVLRRASRLDPIGYKIGLEILVKCGCRRVVEVPIHFAQRRRGQSKLSLSEQLRYLRHLWRLARFRWGLASQFVLFAVVGLSGAAVDLLTYSILLRLRVPVAAARGLAIWLAMTWNFLVNRHVTFPADRHGPVLRQYLRFALGCLAGALLSWSIAVGLPCWTKRLAGRYLPAAALGILAGTALNFLTARMWVFRDRERPSAP